MAPALGHSPCWGPPPEQEAKAFCSSSHHRLSPKSQDCCPAARVSDLPPPPTPSFVHASGYFLPLQAEVSVLSGPGLITLMHSHGNTFNTRVLRVLHALGRRSLPRACTASCSSARGQVLLLRPEGETSAHQNSFPCSPRRRFRCLAAGTGKGRGPRPAEPPGPQRGSGEREQGGA